MKSVQAVGTVVKIQTPLRNTGVNIINVSSMKYFPCLGPIISDLCRSCASEVDIVTNVLMTSSPPPVKWSNPSFVAELLRLIISLTISSPVCYE